MGRPGQLRVLARESPRGRACMKLVRTALVAAVGLTSVIAGVAVAGTADGQGAQKRALVVTNPDNGDDQCQAGTTGASNGFAILNAPGKVGSVTKVNGEVALK